MSNQGHNPSYSPNDANMSGRHLVGDPLFEMPPFPPWNPNNDRSTHERSLSTPLRRRTRRTLKIFSETKDSTADDSVYSVDSTRPRKVESAYDFHPFTNKKLISKRKIDNILTAERAGHCLVFHKQYHPNGIDNFRPDLNIDCEDKAPLTSSLLIDYPGMIKDIVRDASGRRYRDRGPGKSSSGDGGRVVKPVTKMLELKVFWENSDLLNHLETDTIIRQNTILQKELHELADIKKQLKAGHIAMPLKEQCAEYLERSTRNPL